MENFCRSSIDHYINYLVLRRHFLETSIGKILLPTGYFIIDRCDSAICFHGYLDLNVITNIS